MKRTCGGCTMCCKVMVISDMTPVKPGHTWCSHCTIGKGCNIYPDRPASCRGFECLWLQDERGILGDDMRPDKIKVVLQPLINGGTIVHCSPDRPLAWQHPKLLPKLRLLAKAGYPVSVEAKTRHWIITETAAWEAPDDCKETLPNGMLTIRCPDEVQRRIGLYIRPECRDLGPVINPILQKQGLTIT